jgi:hypothetical protein
MTSLAMVMKAISTLMFDFAEVSKNLTWKQEARWGWQKRWRENVVQKPDTRPQAAAPASFRPFFFQPCPTCCPTRPYSQIPKRAAKRVK